MFLLMKNNKSSHQEGSAKTLFLKILQFSLGKTLKSPSNKIARLRACSIIKKKLRRSYFPGNIGKFIRMAILKNICDRLSLKQRNKCESFNNFEWVIITHVLIYLKITLDFPAKFFLTRRFINDYLKYITVGKATCTITELNKFGLT